METHMTLTLGISFDGDTAALETSMRSLTEHAGMPSELVVLADAGGLSGKR